MPERGGAASPEASPSPGRGARREPGEPGVRGNPRGGGLLGLRERAGLMIGRVYEGDGAGTWVWAALFVGSSAADAWCFSGLV